MAPFYKHVLIPKFEAYANRRILLKDGPFRIQIPCMRLPYGVSEFNDGIRATYSLDFTIDNNDFLEFLQRVEEACVSEVASQSKYIFCEQTLSPTDVRSMFVSCVKAHDLGVLPTFRAKVDMKTNFYDGNGHSLDVEETGLPEAFRGYTARSIVEAKSLYFMDRKIGLSWRVDQLKVFPPGQGPLSPFLPPQTKFHFRNVVRYVN